MLNAPASQQMLILRGVYNNLGLSSQNNTFLDNEYRTMITFPPNAQPPYRMVATSDEAECGTPVLAPNAPLINISGNFFYSPLPFIVRTKWKTEISVNALPQQQTAFSTRY